MSAADRIPVLVGAGQVTEQVPDDLREASSYVDLAAMAVERAIADTGAEQLTARIDAVAAVRTFEDTMPGSERAFNGPQNLPWAVAKRVGADPAIAIYEKLGGQSPQRLVNEFAERCHRGECDMALLFGVEVIANVRAARRAGLELDWSEPDPGEFTDRGGDEIRKLMTPDLIRHGLLSPIQGYGLMETARRADIGMSPAEYALQMGELFAAFSRVAAANPLAWFPRALSPDEIITPGERNPMLASPYTLNMVARDGVNQSAAVIVTTAGKARSMGVPETNWIYLHGYAETEELDLMQRPGLGRSPALYQALTGALDAAGREVSDIRYFDLYSCFPIVVLEARETLGIPASDPRALTQTGGLPYFGGPGNNYSMHAIASMMQTLRGDTGSHGLVYANGGFMSKHAVGVYSSAAPAEWQPCSRSDMQEIIDGKQRIETVSSPVGAARIESWVVNYGKGSPAGVIIAGRQSDNGARFLAVSMPGDKEMLAEFTGGDPLGRSIRVQAGPEANTFTFSD